MHTHTSYGKHLPPFFFWNPAYLCPSVIPLLIWLLLFIISSCNFSLAPGLCLFEHLFLRVTAIVCKCVWVHACICLILALVSVCDFFSFFSQKKKARYCSTKRARQKIKARQMRIPATWAPIFAPGSDDSWAFLSPVDLFCCLLLQFFQIPSPQQP